MAHVGHVSFAVPVYSPLHWAGDGRRSTRHLANTMALGQSKGSVELNRNPRVRRLNSGVHSRVEREQRYRKDIFPSLCRIGRTVFDCSARGSWRYRSVHTRLTHESQAAPTDMKDVANEHNEFKSVPYGQTLRADPKTPKPC